MTRKKPTSDPERKFIINLITSDRFCKEITPLIRSQYFNTSYAREVSSWIIEYYQQFEKAPGKDIKSIYHSKRSAIQDEDTIDEVSTFLSSISKEYETYDINNIDYEIHAAILYLQLRSLECLSNTLIDAITDNEPSKGIQALSNFKRVEKPFGQGVSLLHDTQKIIDAHTESNDAIFTFPGAFGKVAGPQCRGDFLSFLAPMKRGKTWYLGYAAETAMIFSNKVIFFTLEMTENQMIRRMWRSLMGQPKRDKEIKIPYFIESESEVDDEKWVVEYKEEERKGINIEAIEDMQKKLRRKFRKGDIRIIALPSKSASVSDLNIHLDNMEHYENYIPDVIIIDYADLLIANKGFKGEYRHQLDDIWSGLRRMSEERNCLVVTASQTEKGTFKKDIDEGSAAEDIRKIAHITCGLALNQTKEEAEQGIIRVSQVVTREEERAFQQAIVLQCLDIGRPCLDSRLRNQVMLNKKINEENDDYSRKKSE
jgi:hypothetical protein